MTGPARALVALYIVALTVVAIAGEWPLQGPRVIAVTATHGLHVGDLFVLSVSAAAAVMVLRAR